MRSVIAILLLIALSPIATVAASSRLPENVSIFITSWDSLAQLVDDPITGWPLSHPLEVFTEAHVFDLELGPDGYLYLSLCRDNSIIRCTRSGVCAEFYHDPRLYPADLEFGYDGELFFSTLPKGGTRETGDRSMGVWRINIHSPNPEGELVLESEFFRTYTSTTQDHYWPTLCFIPTGPCAGGLLVTFAEAAPIVRVDPPDYGSSIAYTSEHLPSQKGFFLESLPDGTLLVADEEAGVISQFDVDGRYLGEFADCGLVFQLKADSWGRVYVTQRDRGLTILSPEGDILIEIGVPVFGIAVVED